MVGDAENLEQLQKMVEFGTVTRMVMNEEISALREG